jgi:hypothetical protein
MASWHPNHHDQHLPGDYDANWCPDEPGVRIRPVTFDELEDYLEHLASPTQRPPLPRARVVGITSPGAALAWRLRFRATADTVAWRRGAIGEQRTARLLAPLERHGYQVFHDLAIPGSAANLDHLVVGPTGVFVIDSKRYRGHLHYSAGRLWHGRRPLDRTLDTLWWEATQVAETLGFGPTCTSTPSCASMSPGSPGCVSCSSTASPCWPPAPSGPPSRRPAKPYPPSRSSWSPRTSTPASNAQPEPQTT